MAKKGKKAERDDRTGGEKLIEAIKANDLEQVKQLIADGADVSEMPEEETPIGVAAEMGNEQIVDALLKAGADPSFGGLSVPLTNAVWNGHDGFVRKLLDAGAEVDGSDEEGMTALMTAARKGRADLVQMLLDAGADAKAIDSDGVSALLYGKEHPAVVDLLKPRSAADQVAHLEPKPVAVDPNDVNAPDDNGRTPLYHAAQAGDLPLAKRLLAAGAKIDAADHYGQTPLMAALGHKPKDLAMMRWLAQSGANLHVKDEYGRTLLSLADRYLPPNGVGEEEDQRSLRALFVEIGLISEAASKLTQVAGAGDLEAVKKLLADGTGADATDQQGRTPLWMAVSRRRPEVVAFLLKGKASPSNAIGSDDGIDVQYGGKMMPCPKCKKPFIALTARRICPACGHPYHVRDAYRDAPDGTDLVFCYANGHTPLMGAARLNDLSVAKLLLDAGAKVDAGKDDCTPLMCACTYEHIEMAKLLIDRGADVNAVCEEAVSDDLTAVGIAGESQNIELLELLWSTGAKTENKDATRLIAAAAAGDAKRIGALLKSGVDVNAIDSFSRNTAVYAASVNGRPDALRTLLKAGGSITPPKRGLAPLLMTASAICEGLPRKIKTREDVPRYVETFKLLIEAGAKVKVAMFGMTPLDLAKDAKCKPLIELFETAMANEKPGAKGKTKKK